MVYRALGDVDRALTGIEPTDGARQLKTIETFAIECSINKVATSEALAYVVDEAVQVFGGNGYSREFPVERAYRDARITRIYEGTNEINRLIIPTRLLKNARSLLSSPVEAPPVGSAVTAEYQLGTSAKRLAIAALAAASDTFGETVRDEQEVLAQVANIVIEAYAIESAAGRAEKLAKSGSGRAPLAAEVAQVYASDAADRILHAAKTIVNALSTHSNNADTVREAMSAVATHRGVDTVAARRRIGDAAIEAGRYPF
jgi:alkylation response protein AidB-like acyl-CoA dehydrogenase